MNAHQGIATDEGLSDQLDRVADSVMSVRPLPSHPEAGSVGLWSMGIVAGIEAMHIQWELTNTDFPSPRLIWLLSRLNA